VTLGALVRAAALGLAHEGARPSRLVRARAAALRLALAGLFRRRDLPGLLEALAPRARPGRGCDAAASGRVVAALRWWPVSCLWRALTGYAALRGGGASVRFLIGVRATEGGDLVAHAWLEQESVPLAEPEDPRTRFTVAFVFPRPAAGSPEECRMPDPTSPPDVILTELQDGTGVLLHLGTKFYYALNRTGVAVWRQVERGVRDVDAVAREIARQFEGVDEGRARADVAALLESLRAERLLPPEP
jgi:hypothetical protein